MLTAANHRQSSIVNRQSPSGLFRSSPLDQAMGVYLPATAAFRLINFVRILLLTWWMSRQQFGLLVMILAVINVMTPLCSLGLNEAVTRYVPQHETRGTLRIFLRRSFLLLIALAALSIALIMLFSPVLGDFFYAQLFADPAVWEEFHHDAPQLARLTGAVIGLVIVYFYLLAVLKGLRMFVALTVMELSHALLFLAGAFVAYQTRHLSALTLTAMYGVSLGLPIAWFGIGLIRSVTHWDAQQRLLAGSRTSRRLLQFSIWTTIAGVTWQILLYYPTWFLNKIHGHEAVAVFGTVRQIGQFVLVGAVAVGTVVATTITKTWESRGRPAAERQLSLAFRGTGLVLLSGCAAIALAKNLIMYLFKPEYMPGATVLPLQLLFFLIGAYLAFLPIYFHLIEKTRHLFLPWAIGVAANVLLAIWLVGPRFVDVQGLAAWQAVAPITSRVFVTGFSDPQGLDAATWCGVFAITSALVMCILLIRAERGRLDRGTYVVIASAVLLTMKPWLLAIGVLTLLLLALRTRLIFTPDERDRLTGYMIGAWRHAPGVGSFGRRTPRAP